MSQKLGRALSDTAYYAIGVIVQNITSLVMLPIYTRYLVPADYGIVEMLSMILDVTLIVFGLRADQGLFRYYHAFEDSVSRNAVVSTTLFLTLALNSVGVLFLIGFSSQLADAFLGNPALWNYLAIYSLCLLAPALVSVPYSYTRLLGRPGLFLALSLTKLVVQVSLNILFVVVFELKALGVIYSTITTQLLLGSFFTWGTLAKVGWKFDRAIAKRLVSFSLPIVVSSIASFYVVFGDRFFLQRSWGLATVGLYGLAYRFGFAFCNLTYEPFRRAWDGHKYLIHAQGDAVGTFQLVFGLITKGLILAALAVSLVIGDFLRFFVGEQYWGAASLIPILMAAYVVRPLTDFCNFGLLIKEKTRHMAQASWLAAGVMTIGYLVLIPKIGAMGAAITAFVGFAVELAWTQITATRYYDMRLPWKRFIWASVIATGAFALSLPLAVGSLQALALRVGIFLVAAAAVFISPATNAEERDLVRHYAGIAARRVFRRGAGNVA